jgi:hypothetical protein
MVLDDHAPSVEGSRDLDRVYRSGPPLDTTCYDEGPDHARFLLLRRRAGAGRLWVDER